MHRKQSRDGPLSISAIGSLDEEQQGRGEENTGNEQKINKRSPRPFFPLIFSLSCFNDKNEYEHIAHRNEQAQLCK